MKKCYCEKDSQFAEALGVEPRGDLRRIGVEGHRDGGAGVTLNLKVPGGWIDLIVGEQQKQLVVHFFHLLVVT